MMKIIEHPKSYISQQRPSVRARRAEMAQRYLLLSRKSIAATSKPKLWLLIRSITLLRIVELNRLNPLTKTRTSAIKTSLASDSRIPTNKTTKRIKTSTLIRSKAAISRSSWPQTPFQGQSRAKTMKTWTNRPTTSPKQKKRSTKTSTM